MLLGLCITRLTSVSEAWRYTGPFSRVNRFRGLFPGFGIASVAFAAYCAYEYAFLQNDHHHHDSGAHHGQEHERKA